MTKTVILRPFSDADRECVLNIVTNETVARTYMLPDYENADAAKPLFNRLMELSKDETRFVRCIELDGTAIGFLNDVEIKDGTIELGYVIHPDYHNRGYMTLALTAALEKLFASGYTRVICGAFEENIASQRVMEKCGMLRTEKMDVIPYRGKTHRCVYFERKLK